MLRRASGVIGTTALVGLATLAWGSLVERQRFTLREHTLALLPAGHRPLRILHLSDLHMAPWQRRKQLWLASLSTLRPDLVIGTGDFLGHERGIDGVVRALQPFRGIPGVFVNGSNDYFGPSAKNPLGYFLGPSKTPVKPKRLNTDELLDFYASLGWIDLNNRVADCEIAGTRIEFFGVDDAHKGYDRLDEVRDRLEDARADRAGASDISIGVTHAPYRRVLDTFTAEGAGLICAGHTHGGQVCLPRILGGTLVTNCDIPRQQARGLSLWMRGRRRAQLNVSAGVGTSIYAPLRLFCPPEATLLTLTAAN